MVDPTDKTNPTGMKKSMDIMNPTDIKNPIDITSLTI